MTEADRAGAGLITVEQAATLLMKSKERVRQLAAQGYIQKVGRDRYPLVSVVQGYLRFRDDVARRQAESPAESSLKVARAGEIEMRMAERRGRLMERAEADFAMDILVKVLREEFCDFAASVSADPTVRARIDAELQEVLGAIDRGLIKAKKALSSGEASLRGL